MEYTYTLQSNDFLQHQLYLASISEKIARKKKLGWLIFSVASFCFAVYCYLNDSTALALYFGVIAVIWYLFYPKYFNWKYYKHYNSFINDHYKSRFNKLTTTTFSKQYITATDETGEGKIKTSEVKNVVETSIHIFIQFNNGSALIIPKQEIENIDNLKKNLIQIGLTIKKL